MTNYAKPTLKALRDRAISELNSNIQGADATLRRRVLKVIAIICAAMADEILRRVEYLLKQVFPTEADEQYLIKHGKVRNFPRKSASKATGSATFTGCVPGSVVPEATELKRADNVLYTTTAEATAVEDGFITLSVIATDASENGNADPGTVTVRFMMDDTYPDGIPNADDVAAVQSHIADLKPTTSTLYVVAPVAAPVNITFSRLSPATQAVRQTIEQNLKSLFQSSTNEPGVGIALSAINTAIGKAEGVEDFALTSPASNVNVAVGHIPTLGTIAYPSE